MLKTVSRLRYVADKWTWASDIIRKATNMSAAEVTALIDLGAVRVNNEVLLSDQALAPRDFMQAYITPKRYTARTRDRLARDGQARDQLARDGQTRDWQWLVASTRHFCVMDKPAGLPSVPSKDNRRECLISRVTAADSPIRSRVHGPLLLTSRLDTGTHGLLMLARTAQFQRYFNAIVGQKHFVRKNYQAVVATRDWQAFLAKYGHTRFPIDLTHWTSRKWSDNDSYVIPDSARPSPGLIDVQHMTVESGGIQRTLVQHVPDEEYSTELKLLVTCARGVSDAPVTLNDTCQQLLLTENVTLEHCAPLTPFDLPWLRSVSRDLTQHSHVPPLVMLDLQLLTGKTHQIRAQLTHEGMTILGDALYGNKHVLEPDMWALCCSQLSFPCPFPLDDSYTREDQPLTGVNAGFQLHSVLRGKSQPHVFKPESWLKFNLQQHRHASDT